MENFLKRDSNNAKFILNYLIQSESKVNDDRSGYTLEKLLYVPGFFEIFIEFGVLKKLIHAVQRLELYQICQVYSDITFYRITKIYKFHHDSINYCIKFVQSYLAKYIILIKPEICEILGDINYKFAMTDQACDRILEYLEENGPIDTPDGSVLV
ncbi:hypothetical protein RF11_00727 [Thelohanellus kitauei]|uniref:Uncharacterized protein n=1 Tax=Thelohanellus kitauei TaxID=669202 RepID=A0A0C2JYP2_THEKT|nr:hypothetical protein RF11_00727 [Thelohanellus kitauei]